MKLAWKIVLIAFTALALAGVLWLIYVKRVNSPSAPNLPAEEEVATPPEEDVSLNFLEEENKNNDSSDIGESLEGLDFGQIEDESDLIDRL
ncbi:MAG: hypothetical protein WC519_01670 [Parcubacteria group bacterium]